MCGIVGVVHKNREPCNQEVLNNFTESIHHRGPTSGGTYINGHIGIGNRRLAIIDLQTGTQPLTNEDGSIVITYNGEIYNYLELTRTLSTKGHKFVTQSDTEMVVHAYEEWGAECVKLFRGMFAFAILDLNKSRIFIARDQLGIKPLYYLETPEYFAFASELQAFHTLPGLDLTLDLESINQYLWLQYIPAPGSIFNEVKKLPPASFITVDLNGVLSSVYEYWNFSFSPIYGRSTQEWLERLDEAVRETITTHLISDVPFGAFLSGGIDSSIITAYMAPILNTQLKTFTIGFEESDFSELDLANFVSTKFKTEHHYEIIKPEGLKILPELVRHYGEPFGDSSAIPTYYVSKLASNEVPMVLSGDGGDELFAGYASYGAWMTYMTGLGLSPIKRLIKPFVSFIFPEKFTSKPHIYRWTKYIEYLAEKKRLQLWRPEYWDKSNRILPPFERVFNLAKDFDLINIPQYMDIKTYLPYDILTKVDIASMMHGLEVRTPFVDVTFLEFAATIPSELNIQYSPENGWEGKLLFKELLNKHFSKEFIHRKKRGFSIPSNLWFGQKGKYHSTIKGLLADPTSPLLEIFTYNGIESIIAKQNNGPIWLLVFLNEWLVQNHSRFSIR